MLPVFSLYHCYISEYGSLDNSQNKDTPEDNLVGFFISWNNNIGDTTSEQFREGFRQALIECGYNRYSTQEAQKEPASVNECLLILPQPLKPWRGGSALSEEERVKKYGKIHELNKGFAELIVQEAYEGKYDFLFLEAV